MPLKRFYLLRGEDVTGVSGTGVVAEGVEFTDGVVVIRWMSAMPTTVIHNSMESVIKIHSHDGKTQIVWKDE